MGKIREEWARSERKLISQGLTGPHIEMVKSYYYRGAAETISYVIKNEGSTDAVAVILDDLSIAVQEAKDNGHISA